MEAVVDKLGRGWDPFNLSSFPSPSSLGFLKPSYECVRWKLINFARSWEATQRKNRQMLKLYDKAEELGILTGITAEDALKMPIPERIIELERLIKEFEADLPPF